MSVNNSLRSEIAETIANYGPGCIAALYGPFTENPEEEADKTFETMLDDILSLIESKMPEKKKPSDKDFSLDEGINPTYDEDGDLVDFGRPPQKHKMNRPYNDGWNAYHDEVKSILRGTE